MRDNNSFMHLFASLMVTSSNYLKGLRILPTNDSYTKFLIRDMYTGNMLPFQCNDTDREQLDLVTNQS